MALGLGGRRRVDLHAMHVRMPLGDPRRERVEPRPEHEQLLRAGLDLGLDALGEPPLAQPEPQQLETSNFTAKSQT